MTPATPPSLAPEQLLGQRLARATDQSHSASCCPNSDGPSPSERRLPATIAKTLARIPTGQIDGELWSILPRARKNPTIAPSKRDLSLRGRGFSTHGHQHLGALSAWHPGPLAPRHLTLVVNPPTYRALGYWFMVWPAGTCTSGRDDTAC